MDSAVSTAARALSMGDPLLALNFIALRIDPPALALRGIAMAQLGELPQARALLRRAATAFGHAEPLARARCVVAEAEVALALRDLGGAGRGLDEAVNLLARRGDIANAVFARLVQVRLLVLLGQVDAAERALGKLQLAQAPPRLAAVASLIRADMAIKALRGADAECALGQAENAARQARIPALANEVAALRRRFDAPVARLVRAAEETSVRLADLEPLFASGELVVDACRRARRVAAHSTDLARAVAGAGGSVTAKKWHATR